MKKIILTALLLVTTYNWCQTQMPNISLKDLEGKNHTITTDYNEKDKIYIFSFWATWCTPCINELDEMNDVIEDWKKEINVEVVAVATDDTRTQKRIKPLVNGKAWGFNVLLDSNQDLKRSLGIVNIPHTIVVKNNKIVLVQSGYVPGSENELLAKLKAL